MSFVTPYVGVWIETAQKHCGNLRQSVTPYVGVWIETHVRKYYFVQALSHPMWVCGLKPSGTLIRHTGALVTPYVGVWIETAIAIRGTGCKPSHPMWVCGLKLNFVLGGSLLATSHPMWVCGLKLKLIPVRNEQ